MRTLIQASLLILFSSSIYAEGQIMTIEGTRIRGNQELPTVLYVVPWQPAEVKKLGTPKTHFAIQEEVKPLERMEFQRLVSYHDAFLAGVENEVRPGGVKVD